MKEKFSFLDRMVRKGAVKGVRRVVVAVLCVLRSPVLLIMCAS
jgi:hypothetical protein